MLQAVITEQGKKVIEFTSQPFTASELKDGRFKVTEKWKAQKLWDIHTPQNTYEAAVSLLGADENALDAAIPVRFGFRELWIDGQDFYERHPHLLVVRGAPPGPGRRLGVELCGSQGEHVAVEERRNQHDLHEPFWLRAGDHVTFGEILRAADDIGMLVSLTQPHFSRYSWKGPDAEQKNGYAVSRRILRPRGGKSSVGRVLLHQPRYGRIPRRHGP